MNLYRVICVVHGILSDEEFPVYVVATNPSEAEEKGLLLMRNLEYKYIDRVDAIELVASVNTHRAKYLLVL